jgi:hypothetical protein
MRIHADPDPDPKPFLEQCVAYPDLLKTCNYSQIRVRTFNSRMRSLQQGIVKVFKKFLINALICRRVKMRFSVKLSRNSTSQQKRYDPDPYEGLKGRIRIHMKPKKQDLDPNPHDQVTRIRNRNIELKCSKSKNLTGKCFGNPTSWWPAAGPVQQQWWWRSTPSCSTASGQWPGPVRSTSPAVG